MRRPRPRIFWAWTLTLTAALLAVVWVGSMRLTGNVMWPPRYILGGSGGTILLVRYDVPWISEVQDVRGGLAAEWNARLWPHRERVGGVKRGSDFTIWRIPLWPFVLLTGVPGVWMLVKTRKHANPHACPACGYDRTGLPQSPTGPAPCPECGKNV